MITFLIALVLLFAGYHTNDRLIERILGPDDRPMPARSMADGVDYAELSP